MGRDYDFWVYIVTNRNHSVLYIGVTNDLERRLSEHRSGQIPGFTADYRCHKLLLYEYYSDVRDAIDREKQLKGWSRAKKIRLIEGMNPRWFDLTDNLFGNDRDVSTPLDMTEGLTSAELYDNFARPYLCQTQTCAPASKRCWSKI